MQLSMSKNTLIKFFIQEYIIFSLINEREYNHDLNEMQNIKSSIVT